jgi:tetratricopeptide (TPR) repeat protein
MLEHGKSYLELLSRKNNKEKLLEVYSELSGHDGFVPIPVTSFKIASCFNEAGKPKEAIQAYNRFIKKNSGNHLIPKAYFLAANIFNEKLNNPKKAAGILKAL